MNRATLIGHLGADPEVRQTPDGRTIVSFSLATTDKWKSKTGEQKERTEWHRIVVFSEGLTRVAQNYLRKGSQVFIEGQVQTRKWTDKDGRDRSSTEIVLGRFEAKIRMLDARSQSNPDQASSFNAPF